MASSSKGKGVAQVTKARDFYHLVVPSTTDSVSSLDTKPGGASLLDYPDPATTENLSPFEEYTAMKRGEPPKKIESRHHEMLAIRREEKESARRAEKESAHREETESARREEKVITRREEKQPMRPAMKQSNASTPSTAYRHPHASAHGSSSTLKRVARHSVSFADKANKSPRFVPNSPTPAQKISRLSDYNQDSTSFRIARGNLTGSASLGAKLAGGRGNDFDMPETDNIITGVETPATPGSSRDTEQICKTAPHSFAPYQGPAGRSNEDIAPPAFNIHAGCPGTPVRVRRNSVATRRKAITATPHGSTVITAAQMTFHPQFETPIGPHNDLHLRQTSQEVAPSTYIYDSDSGQISKVTQMALDLPMMMWSPLSTTQLVNLPSTSGRLRHLTNTASGKPTIEMAMDIFPFITSWSQAEPNPYGVVRIKNIPYEATRAEILAMLGRNAKLPKDVEEPVHIIMDKTTTKTHDVYVEFATPQDAVKAVDRYEDLVHKHRGPRVGSRAVEMVLSTQAELMTSLFPFAHGILWDGATPVVQPPVDGMPWTMFKGFITEEEITLLTRFVELPNRAPFAKDCPQRPYECMISTIKKFPWHRPELITVAQRHLVYTATLRLVSLLRRTLDSEDHDMNDPKLNAKLLRRVFTAAMMCPGFSLVQKDNIAFAGRFEAHEVAPFNMPTYADSWTHAHTLCPKPCLPVDILEYFIALIREETITHTRYNVEPETREHIVKMTNGANDTGYFGFIWSEMGLPPQPELAHWTLQNLADHEMKVFCHVIQRALTRA